MVRTAAVRVSAGKSSKKGGSKGGSAASTSSKSGGGSSTSLPPITHQDTPTWQKPITNFFKLDAPLKSIENEKTRDEKERNVKIVKSDNNDSVEALDKENSDKNDRIKQNCDKDEENVGSSKHKKRRFMNLDTDSSDNEELENMRMEIQEKIGEHKGSNLDKLEEADELEKTEKKEEDKQGFKELEEKLHEPQPGSSKA